MLGDGTGLIGGALMSEQKKDDAEKPFAVRSAEHPIWEKIEAVLDKAEGVSREQRVAREAQEMRASVDKQRVQRLRGGRTSFFGKPQPGTMEHFLNVKEISFLSDTELLALDDRLTNEMFKEAPRITRKIVRKWADEITNGQLEDRLQADKEWREEEDDWPGDWLDSHLGGRDR
jgi:hypothetical protein